MSPEQKAFFSDQFPTQFGDVVKGLGELSQTIQQDVYKKTDWDDFRNKIEQYLTRLQQFAKQNKADECTIQAGIGWPPRVDVSLTFGLK